MFYRRALRLDRTGARSAGLGRRSSSLARPAVEWRRRAGGRISAGGPRLGNRGQAVSLVARVRRLQRFVGPRCAAVRFGAGRLLLAGDRARGADLGMDWNSVRRLEGAAADAPSTLLRADLPGGDQRRTSQGRALLLS